jgi:hypothetical protein
MWSLTATDRSKYTINRIIKEYLCFRCNMNILKLLIEELHNLKISLNIIRGQKVVSIPKLPDGLWETPSLIFNGHWSFFPGGKATGA